VIQIERVRRALRRRGSNGITQHDFLGNTIDGGPAIQRLAARIYDLRQAGEHIIEPGHRDGCVIYVLRANEGSEHHAAQLRAAVDLEPQTVALFEDAAGRGERNAIYDCEAA